jgi:hypothetical protein
LLARHKARTGNRTIYPYVQYIYPKKRILWAVGVLYFKEGTKEIHKTKELFTTRKEIVVFDAYSVRVNH